MAELNGQYTTGATLDMSVDAGLRKFMIGVYNKMALGLVVTGATAYWVSVTPAILNLLYVMQGGYITGYTPLGLAACFAPLVMVLVSNFVVKGFNAAAMGAFYWAIVAVMGVSLSSILLLYTGESVASTFFISAAAFGALSLAGYTTKINMTGWGSFLFMGVIGILVASLANFFFIKSDGLGLLISYAGVLIFSALIAYKTQWLKSVYYQIGGNQAGLATMTYYGALSLYISFINLFLSLLRILGSRR